MRYFYEKFEEIVLIILLVAMVLVMGLQIICRYLLLTSIVWSEEAVRYMFVASTFMGLSYSIKTKSLLSVSLFVNKLPKKYNLLIEKIINYFTIIVCGILSFFALGLVLEYFRSFQKSPALNMPLWILYFMVFVGLFLSFIRSVENFLKLRSSND